MRHRPILLKKQLLGDEVFRRIADAIVSGELAAGERLRGSELAEQLDVSLAPIREALARLERIGLVAVVPGKHTAVTEITTAAVAHTLEFSGYQAGIAMHHGVPNLTAEQRGRAVELVDAISAADDNASASRARAAFFAYVMRVSDNKMHLAHIEDVEVALSRNLSAVCSGEFTMLRNPEIVADLRAAVLAGHAGDAEVAVRRMHGIAAA